MSKDQLNPELLTVCGLFDHDTVYTVPIYQRNYAWRIEQIEQLVSDIQDAVVRSESGYFLGNLVVTQRASRNDFEVIDGQQRLTTLYLLELLTARIHDLEVAVQISLWRQRCADNGHFCTQEIRELAPIIFMTEPFVLLDDLMDDVEAFMDSTIFIDHRILYLSGTQVGFLTHTPKRLRGPCP